MANTDLIRRYQLEQGEKKTSTRTRHKRKAIPSG